MIKQGKAFEELKLQVQKLISDGEEYINLSELKQLMNDINYSEYQKPYKGIEVAEELSNFVNSTYNEERGNFVRAVVTDHRTLQYDTFNLFHKCTEEWARSYSNGNFDGRNEYSCKMASIIVNHVNGL